MKRITKLKEHEIVTAACGPHVSAMIGKDGKLFMFGSTEEDLVDKSTGGCGYKGNHTQLLIYQ